MKILLLEDDLALSDIIEDHLTHEGYDVTLATNGQDALEYLIDNNYDLALLDINTPIMSGIEVLKTIREEYKDQTPAFPAILFRFFFSFQAPHHKRPSIRAPAGR